MHINEGGLPSSSAGNESDCNARDPGSGSGWGRSPEEGLGDPLQYSWASLVAQTVENLPVMQETWVQSLGWEDPLEEGVATHSSILAWTIPMGREAWRAIFHGVEKSRTQLSDFHLTFTRKSWEEKKIEVKFIFAKLKIFNITT